MSATDELEHYMTACSSLRAENARLQERVKETEAQLDAAMQNMDAARAERNRAESERDEAQGKLEAVTEAWEFVELAWTDSDVHPRHAPDECDSCDAVWAMLMVIRDAILRGTKEGE